MLGWHFVPVSFVAAAAAMLLLSPSGAAQQPAISLKGGGIVAPGGALLFEATIGNWGLLTGHGGPFTIVIEGVPTQPGLPVIRGTCAREPCRFRVARSEPMTVDFRARLVDSNGAQHAVSNSVRGVWGGPDRTWNGTWNASWQTTLRCIQQVVPGGNDRVSCTYTQVCAAGKIDSSGTITGQVFGSELIGTWAQPLGPSLGCYSNPATSGAIVFRLASDGMAFRGNYWNGARSGPAAGDWDGTLVRR